MMSSFQSQLKKPFSKVTLQWNRIGCVQNIYYSRSWRISRCSRMSEPSGRWMLRLKSFERECIVLPYSEWNDFIHLLIANLNLHDDGFTRTSQMFLKKENNTMEITQSNWTREQTTERMKNCRCESRRNQKGHRNYVWLLSDPNRRPGYEFSKISPWNWPTVIIDH